MSKFKIGDVVVWDYDSWVNRNQDPMLLHYKIRNVIRDTNVNFTRDVFLVEFEGLRGTYLEERFKISKNQAVLDIIKDL